MTSGRNAKVKSTIGERSTDTSGVPVAVVRMNPGDAYAGVPTLLERFINRGSPGDWKEITSRVDCVHANLGRALAALDAETGFGATVRQEIARGKRLLIKPNLVNPNCIDPVSHAEAFGHTACTDWAVVAATMRWFHDALSVSYHDMALGEAASATSVTAVRFNEMHGGSRPITTEAVIEGRSGDFYGGWGFYFVRLYLRDRHDASHDDDPMAGHEESVTGTYLPPGRARGRLMVYDLNRLYDSASKGRTVPVPDGANYQEITLHKVVVGGDPADAADSADYPGCVLVNVPKLKIHSQDLLTNAVKNLGIGLYPQEAPRDDVSGPARWKYGSPDPVPGMKTELPHMPWIPSMDDETGLPLRDEKGDYIVTRTRGMPGTQADVIRATQNQDVFMVHVIDAIETTNINHVAFGVRVLEGYLLASLDAVAVDLVCARYCFKTVPVAEARRLQAERGLGTDFLRTVPVAVVEGESIVTGEDVDSPLLRYGLYDYAEARGVGRQESYIVGWDAVSEAPLASLEGHLGWVEDGHFNELITSTMYFSPGCMLWDMQRTVLSWAEASDRLTGSTLHRDIMTGYDENDDGVIDYDENGRKGHWTPLLRAGARGGFVTQVSDEESFIRAFRARVFGLKYSDSGWNADGHHFLREFRFVTAAATAWRMSQAPTEAPDPFFPAMTWGGGKWPSYRLAAHVSAGTALFGLGFPGQPDLMSPYGIAFQYADRMLGDGGYTAGDGAEGTADALSRYLEAVAGGAEPMDFVLYVPLGYGRSNGGALPNVEETDDPARVLTASFGGGQEVW